VYINYSLAFFRACHEKRHYAVSINQDSAALDITGLQNIS